MTDNIVERLRRIEAENSECSILAGNVADVIEAERMKAADEIQKLRAALKPFTWATNLTVFELLYSDQPDDTLTTFTVKLGDLRAAKAALGER